MKRIAFILPVCLFFVAALALPDPVLAKKGGKGNGGGYSEDGIFHHSHSERSYSGKDHFKGKGNAYGRMRNSDGGIGSPHGHGGSHDSDRRWHGSHHRREHHHRSSYH